MSEKLVIELRWDPVLREWVMVSNIREHRPWRPSTFCPFCPGAPETSTGGSVLILENRFPMLVPNPPKVIPGEWPFIRAEAYGRCFVVVETPQHNLDDISDLPEEQIRLVVKELSKLFKELSKDRRLVYALWFRNKGEEIGVSLTHPHSQIYVLPYIPAKVFRELLSARDYWKEKNRCMFCDILVAELYSRERIVYENKSFVAFVPFWAHWPFEVHIYSRRHVGKLGELSENEIADLANILKVVLQSLKKVFEKPMPYIMVLHQAPLRGDYPFYHMHFEIYGMYRVSGKLKYAAGMETGGGNFTYDSTPERVASILREAVSRVLSRV